ncbi:MAG: peptidylprolyl isomerase [Sphingobium sp.]|nr:peptidylprolyl isomerase [Sphingobium sp.]
MAGGGVAMAHAAEPQVRIETSYGVIEARLHLSVAPISVCNFLRYVAGGYYDGGQFFRTVRHDVFAGNAVPIDVIQMEARDGEETNVYGPIMLERTSETHLTHRAGALSMARWGPDTATSSFSIVVHNSPEMDYGGRRNPDGQGFAVFGQVDRGMDVVRKIYHAEAYEEKLKMPVKISAIRLKMKDKDQPALRAACPALF